MLQRLRELRFNGWQATASVILAAGVAALVLATPHRERASDSKTQHLEEVRESLKTLPLAFEKNEGQTASQVKYLARGSGYSLFLTPKEAVLRFDTTAPTKGTSRGSERKTHSLGMRLVGANPKARITADQQLPGRVNYYLGNDPKRWRRNLPTFARVRYEEAYPGVDVLYYGKQRSLEYDFVVQPHSDPGQIRLGIAGADRVSITNSGDLLMEAGAGTLRQPKPEIYQEQDGKRRRVDGGYTRLADGSIGFKLGAYDTGLPLVIDPTIDYGTMVGGTGGEEAYDWMGTPQLTTIVGQTSSTNFPVGSFSSEDHALGTTTQTGTDGFIIQLDKSRTGAAQLISATYIGGDGNDRIESILPGVGLYFQVAGTTNSNNFPSLTGAYDTTYNGGDDAFVARFLSGGYESSTVLWGMQFANATYLGGSGNDSAHGMTYVPGGYGVVGTTNSSDYPTNTYMPDTPTGGTDGFLTYISTNLSTAGTSLRLGGSGTDSANDVAVGPGPSLYVTGSTSSSDFPRAGDGPVQSLQGSSDAYVTKFAIASGISYAYSRLVGGTGTETGYAVTVDNAGRAYVTGETASLDFPVQNAAQGGNGGGSDAFLSKLSLSGGSLEYSTYLGGAGSDVGYAVALSNKRFGVAFVGGSTSQQGLPPGTDGGGGSSNSGDGFVTQIDTLMPAANSSVNSLIATAYLGGSGGDAVYAVGNTGVIDGGAAAAGTTGQGVVFQDGFQGYVGGTDGFFTEFRSPWPQDANYNLGVIAWPPVNGEPTTQVKLELYHDPNGPNVTILRRTDTTPYALAPVTYLANKNDGQGNITTLWLDNDAQQHQGTRFYYLAKGMTAPGHTSQEIAYTTPVDAPSNLTATEITSSQINLSWTNTSENHNGFEIERRTTSGSFQVIASVGPTANSYADNNNGAGLAPDTTYYYQVYTVDNDLVDRFGSNVANATTYTPPNAPSVLQVTSVTATSVNLSWTDNSTNETGFIIERAPTAAFTDITPLSRGSNGTNTATYSDTSGLTEGTTYYYRVRAVRGTMPSANAGPVSATTTLPAPTNLTATGASTTQINLTWSSGSTTHTGFKLERSGSPSFTSLTPFTLPAFPNSYSDTTAAAGVTYYYRVRAVKGSVESANSISATGTTRLSKPTGLTATLGTDQVNLSWSDGNTQETGFIISRTAYLMPSPTEFTVGANVTTFADTTVLDGQRYTYTVRAVKSGYSADSDPSDAATVTLALKAPSMLTTTSVSSNQVGLSWMENSSNESGIRVERSTDGSSYALLTTLNPNTTSYTAAAVPGASCAYRVAAIRTDLSLTSYSNVVTVVPPLVAPLGPTVTLPTAGTAKVQWTDTNTNESGYEVERSIDGGSFSLLTTTGASVTSYTEMVSGGLTYSYRVRAVRSSSGAVSAYAGPGSVTPPMEKPGNLSATAVSSSQIDLSWTDNSGAETGFEIERSTDPTYAGAMKLSAAANAVSYQDAGLAPGVLYYYRIRSMRNMTSYSDWESLVWARTKLAKQTNLTAVASGPTRIDLSWVNPNTTSSGIEIQRSADGTTFATLATNTVNPQSYPDTSVTEGSTYWYRVRATLTGSDSVYSDLASATSDLVAPTTFTATLTAPAAVSLAWSDSSAKETGYEIYRALNGGSYSLLTTTGAGATSYVDTTVQPNGTYQYRIRAINATSSAHSAYRDSGTITTGPIAPSNLVAAVVSNTRIDLTWQDNSSNETGFRIERWTDAVPTPVVNTTGTGINTFSATGLTANTTYYFRVQAYNANGNSAFTAAETSLTSLPSDPTDLVAVAVSSSEIQLTWSDNANNETVYKVYRSGNGTDFTLVDDMVARNTTQYLMTGLNNDKKYWFKVRAVNGIGNNVSNTANARTLP